MQVDACIPNLLCQEQVSLDDGYLKEPFIVKDGCIELPTKPGLGIELDDAAVAAKVYDGSWDTPRLFDPRDDAFSEWKNSMYLNGNALYQALETVPLCAGGI